MLNSAVTIKATSWEVADSHFMVILLLTEYPSTAANVTGKSGLFDYYGK